MRSEPGEFRSAIGNSRTPDGRSASAKASAFATRLRRTGWRTSRRSNEESGDGAVLPHGHSCSREARAGLTSSPQLLPETSFQDSGAEGVGSKWVRLAKMGCSFRVIRIVE